MFLGRTLVFGDNYSLMVPGKLFTAYWLRQGVLPLWNPSILGGIPWIEDINQSVLYPSTIFFVIFHPATALNLTLVGHLFLAWWGMFLLARRWTNEKWLAFLAGVGWMFSTQVTGSANNLSTLQSIIWIPWLLWLGELLVLKPAARWWFGVVVWLQFWGGYPQHVVYTIIAAVAFSWFQRWRSQADGLGPVEVPVSVWLKTWVLTGIWTLGITASAWFPFGERLLESTRTQQSLSQAAVGSLNPVMLMKLVWPYFFDQPSAGMKWGPAWSGQPNMVFYLGWIASLSLLWASWKKSQRADWFFGGLTLLTLVISLGAYLPGFTLIQTWIPWFRLGRYPSMVLIITNVALLVWLVTALPRVNFTKWVERGLVGLAAVLLAVGLIGWGVVKVQFQPVWHRVDQVLVGRLSQSAFHTVDRDRVIAQVIASELLLTAILVVASLWCLRRQRWALLAICLSLDLWYHTQGNFFWAPNSIYPSWPEMSQHFGQVLGKEVDPQTRWLTRNSNQPYTDFGSYWEALVVRAPFSDSFVDAAELASYQHAIQLRQGLTPDWNMVRGVPVVHGYTTLLPTNYAALWPASTNQPPINFLPKLDLSQPATQRQLSDWAVGSYLVDTWFTVDEEIPYQQVVNRDPAFSRWQVYQLPHEPRFRVENAEGKTVETIKVKVAETPNRLYVELDNPDGLPWLRIADRYDRYWQAWDNGWTVKLDQSRQMRRVPLVSGQNIIELEYKPVATYLGWWVTILSALTLAAWYASKYISRRFT